MILDSGLLFLGHPVYYVLHFVYYGYDVYNKYMNKYNVSELYLLSSSGFCRIM